MRRRDFIRTLGSTVALWTVSAGAEERDRMRKVGVMLTYAEGDAEGETRLSALRRRLQQYGWTEGSNLRIEVRWGEGKADRMRAAAADLVSIPVDAIVAHSTPLVGILKSLTQKVPIVFTQVADPVGSGFIASYARPGGNITGFSDFDTTIAGKWIEILKEVAPSLEQIIVLKDPKQSNHQRFLNFMESTASALRMQLKVFEASDRAGVEQAITRAADEANWGLIALPGPVNNSLRQPIIKLAALHRVPAIYPFKYYVHDGGLICYSVDQVDQWSNAANYVDRILKGEKPGELPVQAPTKYELLVNLKTAKALGIAVSPSLLARADQVIE
jgi:putative ABC transport system substrate-binding protein